MGRFRGVWRGYFTFDQPSPQGAVFEVYRGRGGCRNPGLDQYSPVAAGDGGTDGDGRRLIVRGMC